MNNSAKTATSSATGKTIVYITAGVVLSLLFGGTSFFIYRSTLPEAKPQQATSATDSTQQEESSRRRFAELRADSLERAYKQAQTPQSLLAYSAALADAGKFEEASAQYEEFFRRFDSTSADARVEYAYTLLQRGFADSATAQTELALQYNPQHPIALFNMGVLMLRKGDTKAAKSWLEKSAAAAPNSAISQQVESVLQQIQ